MTYFFIPLILVSTVPFVSLKMRFTISLRQNYPLLESTQIESKNMRPTTVTVKVISFIHICTCTLPASLDVARSETPTAVHTLPGIKTAAGRPPAECRQRTW